MSECIFSINGVVIEAIDVQPEIGHFDGSEQFYGDVDPYATRPLSHTVPSDQSEKMNALFDKIKQEIDADRSPAMQKLREILE
ncbi:MAG: hypothetical protein KGL39_39875 [Patescibacteria group bacterium]|nr:hypothetical protein [Patescibacteria group bacterium]